VARWLQYFRSSIPVIVIAFDDILTQRPRLFFWSAAKAELKLRLVSVAAMPILMGFINLRRYAN
jgi:hypothetical protein